MQCAGGIMRARVREVKLKDRAEEEKIVEEFTLFV